MLQLSYAFPSIRSSHFLKIEIYTSTFFKIGETDEGPMLETLDYTIRIDSTPTFLYFDF